MISASARATGRESAGAVTENRFSEMETRSMDHSAFKMGSYGAGALWCLKEREGKYITFNNVRIAVKRRTERGWPSSPAGRSRRPAWSMSGSSTSVAKEWSCRFVPECEDDANES
jgi:hypothetical protein